MFRKFDIKVFIVLVVLTVGVDYFNDPTFGQKDIIYGTVSAIVGTFIWGIFKEKLGF